MSFSSNNDYCIYCNIKHSLGRMWNIYVFAICTHGRVPRDGTGSPLAFRCILSCLCDNNVTTCYRIKVITVFQSCVTQLLLYFIITQSDYNCYVCEICYPNGGLLTFLLNETCFHIYSNQVVFRLVILLISLIFLIAVSSADVF